MDIVDFWKQLTEHFNNESKCNFCWFFGAPLADSEANKQDTPLDKSCCMHVLVTETGKNTIKGYNTRTSLLNSHLDDYTFTLLVGKQDDLGTNTYNEQPDHPISESKWVKILKPIEECFQDTEVLNFCQVLGYELRVTSWVMTVKKNYLSQNFTGWQIRGTFRKQII